MTPNPVELTQTDTGLWFARDPHTERTAYGNTQSEACKTLTKVISIESASYAELIADIESRDRKPDDSLDV